MIENCARSYLKYRACILGIRIGSHICNIEFYTIDMVGIVLVCNRYSILSNYRELL